MNTKNRFLLILFFILIGKNLYSQDLNLPQYLEMQEKIGNISTSQRIEYLITAVKNPTQLPSALAGRWHYKKCGTPEFIEAYHLWKKLPQTEQTKLVHLFKQEPLVTCIDSSSYPIKVCYYSEEQESWAQRLIEQADFAWENQVDNWGFHVPRTISNETPQDGTVIYIDDAGGAGGYTAPLDYDPNNSNYACLTEIVIDTQVAASEGSEITLTHEFNHACQLATDCSESLFALESTATWAEVVLYPEYDQNSYAWTFSYFQSQPWHSLSWSVYAEGYQYGASLFTEFVMERFGNNEPQYIAQLWNESSQISADNEPDILDILEQKITASEQLNIEDAISIFSEWRYFVGINDDGNHFERGGRWDGAEVFIDKIYDISDTPIENGNLNNYPEGFGTSYISLKLDPSSSYDLRFVFEGDNYVDWTIKAILLYDYDSYIEDIPVDGQGQADYTITEDKIRNAYKVVFAVTNLYDDFDPDAISWAESEAQYSIYANYAPVLSKIDPSQILQNTTTEATVLGLNLVDGAKIDISGDGVNVESSVFNNSRKIIAMINISENASLGFRDVTITNPDGKFYTKSNAIEILSPAQPILAGIEPEQGNPGDNLDVVITGEGLLAQAEVELILKNELGAQLKLEEITYVDEKTIKAKLSIPLTSIPAAYNLKITNQNGKENILEDAFFITESSGGCACNVAGNNSGNINMFVFLIFSIIGLFIICLR